MENKTAKDIFKIFAALIFATSALLTFGFFYDYLPSIVPDVVDPFTAAIVAGTLGLLIFDGGALAWLKVYLDACDNNDQRNIAISTSVIDIAGSALASLVQIIFAGTTLITLTGNTRYFVGLMALLGMAGVLTFNFVSLWRFHKNSDVGKLKIREANRLGKIRAEEDKQADHLDDLVATKVAQKLAARADEIADEQAERIVADRERLERGRYGTTARDKPTGPPVRANGHAAESPGEMPAETARTRGERFIREEMDHAPDGPTPYGRARPTPGQEAD